MIQLVVKALLSGFIVMIVSELAKRSPPLGALVASLPLVSVLGMIWLWRETANTERLAAHSQATFWYVLPSLPMFLVLPLLLRNGVSFWIAMGICVVMTSMLYLAMAGVLARFGYRL